MKIINTKFISYLIIITIAISCMKRYNSIYQEKQFSILSTNSFVPKGSSEIHFCFQNLSNNFKLIAVKDYKENISVYISTTARLYNRSAPTIKWELTGTFVEETSTIFYKAKEDFSKIDYTTTYCLMLKTLVPEAKNLKQLQFMTTTSLKSYYMIMDRQDYFGRIDQYTLASDPALSFLPDFTLTPESKLIFKNTKVSIDGFFLVTLPQGKVIPTKLDQVYIILSFDSQFLKIADTKISSSLDSTNPVETRLFSLTYEIFDNNIKIYNLGEELYNTRKFPLKIDGISLTGIDTLSMTTMLLWKNTNSVLSSHTIELFSSKNRVITSADIVNVNNIFTLYTKSNWPMKITFSVPVDLDKDVVILKNANKKVLFIASTCDFYLTGSLISNCLSNQSTTETRLTFYNVTAKANTQVTIFFWIFASEPGIPVFSLEVVNKTDSKAVGISTLNIFEAYPNTSNSFSEKLCKTATETGCTNKLIVSENSGNFVLAENTNLGIPDLSNSMIPVKLEDLKPVSSNNFFRIRFRYDFRQGTATDFSLYSSAWAGEWTKFVTFTTNEMTGAKVFTLPTDSDHILGKHVMYFPMDFILPSNSVECKLIWASDVQIKTANNAFPVYSEIVKHISDENTFNNYKPFFASSSSIVSNRIAFDNYDFAGTLATGVFYHLAYPVVCGEPDNAKIFYDCDINNEPANLTLKLANLELSSSCAKYKSDFEFRSLFTAYDFLQTFSVKNTNTIIRANRFVSLLPQPGIFQTVATGFSQGDSAKILASTYVVNSNSADFPCLIELDFTDLTNFYATKTNNRFYLFLLGLELLNFDNSLEYPINKNIGAVGLNASHIYTGTVLKSKYAKIALTGNGLIIGNSIFLSNSSYRNYLTSVVYFTNIVTTSLPDDLVSIPIKCPRYNFALNPEENILKYGFGMTEINFLQGKFSNTYSYDNKRTEETNIKEFIVNPAVSYSTNAANISITGYFDTFIPIATTKLVFKTTSFNGEIEDKTKYMILLLNSNVNLQNLNIFTNEGIVLDSTFYKSFIINKPITLNNVSFSYLLVASVKNPSTFFNGMVAFNSAGMQLEGITLSTLPEKDNDFGMIIGGASNGFMTNFSSGAYQITNREKIIIENSQEITLKVDFVDTSVVKDGSGKNSSCVKIEIKLDANVNILDIYSANFLSITVGGEASNPNATTCTYNIDGFFKCINFNKSGNFYFCNIDLTSNKFTVTKLVTYFKLTNVNYIDYVYDPAIDTSFTVPSLEYTGAKVDFYLYDLKQRTFGELTLKISSDYAPFRNMRMTIEGDLVLLKIDDYVTPTCRIYFEELKINDLETNYFSTCYIDFSNKLIVLTTVNEIFMYKVIPKSFFIKLYPIMISNLADIRISIDAKFNNEVLTDLFVSKETTLASTNIINQAINVSNYIKITNIIPYIPGEIAVIEIQIELNNSDDTKKFFDKTENNMKSINQIRLIMPADFYGTFPDDITLACYTNTVLIESCYNINNKYIEINQFFAYTQLLKLSIYGFKVPDFEIKEIAKSTIMMQFIYYNPGVEPEILLHGTGKITIDLDRNEYVLNDINKNNLAILSQILSNPYPNNLTDLTLQVSLDSLSGLNSAVIIDDLKDSYIWITLPEQLKTTASTELTMTALLPKDDDPENTVTYYIKDQTVYKNMYLTRLTTTYSIPVNFKYWTFKLTNLLLNSLESITNLTEITVYKRNGFLLKTFPMLYTSSSIVPLDRSFFLFTLNRGIPYAYNESKFYFDLVTSFTTKAGVYTKVDVSVVNKNTYVRNASTYISSNSEYSLDYELHKSSYLLDARFNNKVSVYLGLRCEILKGKHFVMIDSSNKDNFFSFPIITVSIDKENKETVIFYTSIGVEYADKSVINLSKGGMVYFWVKPNQPNFSELAIGFEQDTTTTTTLSFPKNVLTVPKMTFNEVVHSYELLSSTDENKQTYNVNVYDNNCYVSKVKSISFQATSTLGSFIPESFNFRSIMTYVNNPDATSSTTGTMTSTKTTSTQTKNTYALNSFVFTFTPTKTNDFPINSDLFCSLYCSDLNPPLNNKLSNLPHDENTWSRSYFYLRVDSGKVVTLNFNNLMREINYTLKCALVTSHAKETDRKNYTEVITAIAGLPLRPKVLDYLTCVSFRMTAKDVDFELAALQILQDEFFFNNYIETGCVTALSQNGLFVDGYNPFRTKCSVVAAEEQIIIDNQNSDSSDDTEEENDNTSTEISSANENTSNSNSVVNTNLRFLAFNSEKNLLNKPNRDQGNNDVTNTDEINNNNNNNKKKHKSRSFKLVKNQLLNENCNSTLFANDINSYTNVMNRVLQATSNNNSTTLDICLTPAQNCPNNPDSKKYDQILTGLFTSQTTGSSSSSSANTRSKFLDGLGPDLKAFYVDFSFKTIDKELKFPKFNITNLSDFKSSETTAIINIIIKLSSNFNKELLCFWSLNSIGLSNVASMTYKDVINCDTKVDILCGDAQGIKIPATINQEAKIELFNRTQVYSFWITCKENLIIADRFSDVQGSLFTPNFPVILNNQTNVTDNTNTTIVDCIFGNPEFPFCCPNGNMDPINENICLLSSFALKFSAFLVVAVIFVLFS